MDISTPIKTAMAAAATVVTDAVNEAAQALVDPSGSAASKVAAGRALNVLGRINTTITKASERVDTALGRLAPRAKKAKKGKTTKGK